MSEEMQLKSAGVTLDLKTLGSPKEGGVAPLELLSEVLYGWNVCIAMSRLKVPL